MNWRQRADRFNQLSERPVIFRLAAHGSGEIVHHVDIAVFQRGIRGDVRVGEKGNGVSVARFAKQSGMAFRRDEFHESHANACQRSAFQKFTTRELRQGDGHGASINKLSAPRNRLNFVVMPKAKHSKAAAFVHSQLFAGLTNFAQLETRIAALPDEKARGERR